LCLRDTDSNRTGWQSRLSHCWGQAQNPLLRAAGPAGRVYPHAALFPGAGNGTNRTPCNSHKPPELSKGSGGGSCLRCLLRAGAGAAGLAPSRGTLRAALPGSSRLSENLASRGEFTTWMMGESGLDCGL